MHHTREVEQVNKLSCHIYSWGGSISNRLKIRSCYTFPSPQIRIRLLGFKRATSVMAVEALQIRVSGLVTLAMMENGGSATIVLLLIAAVLIHYSQLLTKTTPRALRLSCSLLTLSPITSMLPQVTVHRQVLLQQLMPLSAPKQSTCNCRSPLTVTFALNRYRLVRHAIIALHILLLLHKIQRVLAITTYAPLATTILSRSAE